MAIKYVCDCCKKDLVMPSKRVSVQSKVVENGSVTNYHLCRTCYIAFFKPLMTGITLEEKVKEAEVASKAKEASEASETEQQEETVTEEVTTKTEEVSNVDDLTNNFIVADDSINGNLFDKSISNKSQYFTDDRCYDINRLILLGCKLSTISNYMMVPYQNLVQYSKKFKSVMEPMIKVFKPTLPVLELKEYCEEHKNQLGTIRALTAVGTWTTHDIADEVDLPESAIVNFYENIPWFEENFFRKQKPVKTVSEFD